MSPNLKDIGRSLVACFVLILFAFLGQAHCQVPVAPSPMPHLQFFDAAGKPLAGGRVITYAAGTTTLLNTYIDATGTAVNTDPIILDSGGFADIWLANSSYKFAVQNSLGVPQWTKDNITGYLGLTGLDNTWSGANIFSLAVGITPADNQIVLGAVGTQTTLDFAPPAGNITLHFPVTTDTMVGRDTTDTLTHKSLTSPAINGVTVTGGPVQTLCIPAKVTVNGNTTGQQPIQNCTLAAGLLNTLNKTIRFMLAVSSIPGSNIVNQISWGLAPTNATTGQVCSQATGSTTSCVVSITCTTQAIGSSGSIACNGNPYGSMTAAMTQYSNVTLDLTGTLQVGSFCAFASASVTNSCIGQQFIVEQLN